MIDPVLKAVLQPLVRRHRRRQFSLRMARAWGLAAATGLGLWAVQRLTGWGRPENLPIRPKCLAPVPP